MNDVYDAQTDVMEDAYTESRELADKIRALPLAPDTREGTRQRWVRENAARLVEGLEPLSWENEVDVNLAFGKDINRYPEAKADVIVGDRVSKTGGDYTFDGTVVGVIRKRSGATRLVVEDDRGLLFILNPKQVIKKDT